MSIKRDVNGYKVFDLRGGVQLLWAEEDNVLFRRMQGSEMAITTDIDAEFEGIMEAWEHAVVERDRLRKELEEKEIILTGRQYTINRLKEQNEEIATFGIRQGEQITRLIQSEKKLRNKLEEAQQAKDVMSNYLNELMHNTANTVMAAQIYNVLREAIGREEFNPVGQEGEGNQRTIEVTLHNEGYKEHELKFEEQGGIELENKLTLWYNIEKRESVIESVKANIQKRYGFSDGELVSIGEGFKFLFDDETNGEIEITFVEVNGNLKVTVEGSWPWEVIEVYNHCLPQSAEQDPA